MFHCFVIVQNLNIPLLSNREMIYKLIYKCVSFGEKVGFVNKTKPKKLIRKCVDMLLCLLNSFSQGMSLGASHAQCWLKCKPLIMLRFGWLGLTWSKLSFHSKFENFYLINKKRRRKQM